MKGNSRAGPTKEQLVNSIRVAEDARKLMEHHATFLEYLDRQTLTPALSEHLKTCRYWTERDQVVFRLLSAIHRSDLADLKNLEVLESFLEENTSRAIVPYRPIEVVS